MHYRDLKASQRAIDLADAVYEAVQSFPAVERYVLSKQMRASASSIPCNIAEGNGRWTSPDYRHFVMQARGSAYELETQIIIAKKRKFISGSKADSLLSLAAEVCRLINGLIRHIDGDPFDDTR